jgi:hypothetical protein
MNTLYKSTSIKSPFTANQNKSDMQNPKHPVSIEALKNTGTIDLKLTIEKDVATLKQFRAYPGIVAFVCTLKRGSEICGIGRGSTIINAQTNKYFTRAISIARNCSIIDSVMQATKMLNTLSLDVNRKYDGNSIVDDVVEKEEPDLEGRDRPCSFSNDSTLKYATEKQKTFAKVLLSKADKFTKDEYLPQLNEKYLSSFQCSQLISNLLQK